MDTQKTSAAPEFEGTRAEKALAEQLFRVFQTRAAFFSDDAPIRLSLGALSEFLGATSGGGDWNKKVNTALTKNEQIFRRLELDDDVVFETTKLGRPVGQIEDTADDPNDLKARFATPEPRREPPRPRRARAAGTDVIDDSLEQAAPEQAFAPDSWQAAVAAALRDAQAREQQATPPADEAGFSLDDMIAQADAESIPDEDAQTLGAVAADQDTPTASSEEIDVSEASDEELTEAIRNSLSHEPEVARWGDLWMHETKVAKLSRGDLRRAQEYIDENGEPLGDVELVQDLRGINAGSPDFPLERFTVNFRLSREVRDFEYLGTSTEGLWATTSMPALGTDRRKASEIGQDYRFLLDYRTAPEGLEEGIIEHVLTFYEYQFGVLPLDATMASIMPQAAFADQRAARITFESPQTSETFAVELRFPTSNRGGYLVGLEEFFESNLVPGALVTIESTDSPSHFIIEYFQMSGQDRRLLHLDARKNRYIFRPTTFYCGLQDDMLIDENRFPRFADVEPLDERTRRRPDQVVARTFERIGENVGSADEPRYSASLVDLLAAANVERPISVELLRDILTGGAFPEFTTNDEEEDAYFYQP